MCIEIKDQKFVFCPFVPNGRFEDALNTITIDKVNSTANTIIRKASQWKDATCIFAHQEFFGCRFNPVQGDVWSEDNPLIVSGHIHAEQRLQSNVYYPGSSMQHGFSETEDKIVANLTFTKGEPFGLKRVDLGLPKRKTVYIDVQNADSYKPPADLVKETKDQNIQRAYEKLITL